MLEVLVMFILSTLLIKNPTPFTITIFLIGTILIVLPGVIATATGAPFVPSKKNKREIIQKLAAASSEDVVVELGCGDGRILRDFIQQGVKEAIGYELSPSTFLLAKILKFFNRTKEKIYLQSFWKKDFSKATIVICFLSDAAMKRIHQEIWPKLRKGTKLISNEFQMPNTTAKTSNARVYLYIKEN